MYFLQAWCDLNIDTKRSRPSLIDRALNSDISYLYLVYELLLFYCNRRDNATLVAKKNVHESTGLYIEQNTKEDPMSEPEQVDKAAI